MGEADLFASSPAELAGALFGLFPGPDPFRAAKGDRFLHRLFAVRLHAPDLVAQGAQGGAGLVALILLDLLPDLPLLLGDDGARGSPHHHHR